MSDHYSYANTGMTLTSLCVDCSVDDVLHQINPDFTKSLLELIIIPKHNLIDTLLHDSQRLYLPGS